jgi:2',3'-cyclic-nucleotide 2'-phosphodiesterase (5'-nucleotidase family)
MFLVMFFVPIFTNGSELTLIYFGSANGILESCRCPGNPFGGLVNRAAVVDSLREIYPEAIVVDCGDFLPAEPDSLKSVYVVKAMSMIKTDAIAPGEQDFNLGRDYLVNSGLPLMSPSLYNPDTRSYMFQNYIIKSTGTIKTAVIALISPSLFSFFPDSLRQQIGIEAPEASWKRFGTLLR